ncbi:MAG: TolB family protein [Bacillota bacterium]
MLRKKPLFFAATILLALALVVSGCKLATGTDTGGDGVELNPTEGQTGQTDPVTPTAVDTSGTGSPAVTAWALGLQVGSLPVPYQEANYRWLGPEALGILAGGDLRAVADLAAKKVYEVKDVGATSDLSADRSRLAYSVDGKLAVLELATGKVSTWSYAAGGKADPSLSADLLSWSPDGSTIVGALYPPSTRIANKLWSLNLAEGKLKAIGSFDQFNYFCNPAWSPDGRQLVVRRIFQGYTEGGYGEWLLIDLPTGQTSRVAGPDFFNVAYDFVWDADGKVEARPAGVSADGLRVVGYDPKSGQTSDNLALSPDQPEPFVATELRLVSPTGETKSTLDLSPALAKAGFPVDKLKWFLAQTSWSPDGRLLLLTGLAQDDQSDWYPVRGVANAAMDSVDFVPTSKQNDVVSGGTLSEADVAWHDGRALVLSIGGKGLDLLDARNLGAGLTVKHLMAADILHARWVGDAVLYVGNTEIGLLKPDADGTGGGSENGGKTVVLTASAGDYFGQLVFPYVSGDRLAVPVYSPVHSTVWIEALDLKELAAVGK